MIILNKILSSAIIAMVIFAPNYAFAANIVTADRFLDQLPTRSWKDIRDQDVVKQQFDYSCGAASLATLLGYHGVETSELEILDRIGLKEAFSFADLARVAEEYGFKPVGIAIDYTALTQLKRPVILYLNHWDEGHFSVLKGVDNHGALLADPSWGNIHMRRARFERFWLLDNESEISGKVLALLPPSYGVEADPLLDLIEKTMLIPPHELFQ
ncbi:C39 family peptidase [Nitrincola sp.]|uniref:C39 family peptidase n=1 Tax=Nitrincola sp. TaxID=1926584 RepID=UPI003A8E837B